MSTRNRRPSRSELARREGFQRQLADYLAIATLQQIGRGDVVRAWFQIDEWKREALRELKP